MWLFMFKFENQKCLETLIIDYKYCVIDYTSLKWLENVLSQVVTLAIWNLMFYNIGNRLHDYGNQLQLCKSVWKESWLLVIDYQGSNRLPESKTLW